MDSLFRVNNSFVRPFLYTGVGVEGGQGWLYRAPDAAARGLRGLVARTFHARPRHDRRCYRGLRPTAREGKTRHRQFSVASNVFTEHRRLCIR